MSLFKKYYYHGSIERYTSLFGYLMQDMQLESNGKIVNPELFYAGGEHRVQKDKLPKAGLRFTGIVPNEQRSLNRYQNQHNQGGAVQNQRVAGDLQYEYTIRCKAQRECVQVLEQIIGAFMPSIDVVVQDEDILGIQQSITIRLDDWSMEDDWDGEGEQPNYYDLSVNFTLMGHIYRYGVADNGDEHVIKRVRAKLSTNPDGCKPEDLEEWVDVRSDDYVE